MKKMAAYSITCHVPSETNQRRRGDVRRHNRTSSMFSSPSGPGRGSPKCQWWENCRSYVTERKTAYLYIYIYTLYGAELFCKIC